MKPSQLSCPRQGEALNHLGPSTHLDPVTGSLSGLLSARPSSEPLLEQNFLGISPALSTALDKCAGLNFGPRAFFIELLRRNPAVGCGVLLNFTFLGESLKPCCLARGFQAWKALEIREVSILPEPPDLGSLQPPMSTRVCGKLCFRKTVCWPDKLIWEPCVLAHLLSCYFVP